MPALRHSIIWLAAVVASTSCVDDADNYESVEHALTGVYRIKLVHSGKCADVAGGTTATQNGAKVQQWTCTGGTNQQWRLVELGNGLHRIEAMHSGKCLDVSGGTGAVQDGRVIHQWGCHGKANQQFRLVARGGGQYRIEAAHSGKCFDVSGGATGDGVAVTQQSCHEGSNQRVTLEAVGGGGGGGGGGTWRNARLTWFTSYPDPNSEECVKYNGCMWAGWFAALPNKMPESWVAANNIAAVHEKDFAKYKLKTLRVRQGTKQIDVKVYDMCSDSDCNGCCTKNASSTGFLIDLESYTANRFGVWDGTVSWTCIDC